MADDDCSSGQGGGGVGPMVVGGQQPAQAAGAGQAAAAQMPARYTPAPAQRPRPDPNVSSMEDLVEYELELLAGTGPGAGCRLLLAECELTAPPPVALAGRCSRARPGQCGRLGRRPPRLGAAGADGRPAASGLPRRAAAGRGRSRCSCRWWGASAAGRSRAWPGWAAATGQTAAEEHAPVARHQEVQGACCNPTSKLPNRS